MMFRHLRALPKVPSPRCPSIYTQVQIQSFSYPVDANVCADLVLVVTRISAIALAAIITFLTLSMTLNKRMIFTILLPNLNRLSCYRIQMIYDDSCSPHSPSDIPRPASFAAEASILYLCNVAKADSSYKNDRQALQVCLFLSSLVSFPFHVGCHHDIFCDFLDPIRDKMQ